MSALGHDMRPTVVPPLNASFGPPVSSSSSTYNNMRCVYVYAHIYRYDLNFLINTHSVVITDSCFRGHAFLELYKAPQSWLDEKESNRLEAAADK